MNYKSLDKEIHYKLANARLDWAGTISIYKDDPVRDYTKEGLSYSWSNKKKLKSNMLRVITSTLLRLHVVFAEKDFK